MIPWSEMRSAAGGSSPTSDSFHRDGITWHELTELLSWLGTGALDSKEASTSISIHAIISAGLYQDKCLSITPGTQSLSSEPVALPGTWGLHYPQCVRWVLVSSATPVSSHSWFVILLCGSRAPLSMLWRKIILAVSRWMQSVGSFTVISSIFAIHLVMRSWSCSLVMFSWHTLTETWKPNLPSCRLRSGSGSVDRHTVTVWRLWCHQESFQVLSRSSFFHPCSFLPFPNIIIEAAILKISFQNDDITLATDGVTPAEDKVFSRPSWVKLVMMALQPFWHLRPLVVLQKASHTFCLNRAIW